MAKDIPIPKIGPIKGEINIAPITTAVELAFNPMDAMKIEQIKIQEVCPLKAISARILAFVFSASVSALMSNSSFKKK